MPDDLPTGRWRRAAKVGKLAGGQTARGYATKAANLTRSEQARRDARCAAPDAGRGADLRRARPDEGRGDEGRPGGVVHRHRRVPAGVPGAHPGQARRAARRGPARPLQAHAQGDRGRPRRAARRRLRRVRRGGRGGRLDRPGLSRAPARRARGGGQGPVPGRRAGGPRRPAEPGPDHARRQADGARHGRQGDDARDPRAPDRRARLRARGAAAPGLRALLARPPVHLRAAGGHRALHRARARLRVGRGRRASRRSARSTRPRATASARSCSASSSARSTATGTSRATRTPATTA